MQEKIKLVSKGIDTNRPLGQKGMLEILFYIKGHAAPIIVCSDLLLGLFACLMSIVLL